MENQEQKKMQNRIVELETQIAFHEDTIEQLSRIISDQQQQLDKLQQEILLIKKRIDEQQPATSSAEERPPHY